MKIPITIGLLVFLAACGGSGSQTVTEDPDLDPAMSGDPDPTDEDTDVAGDDDAADDDDTDADDDDTDADDDDTDAGDDDPDGGDDADPVDVPEPIIPITYAPELGETVIYNPATDRFVVGTYEVDRSEITTYVEEGNRAFSADELGFLQIAQVVDGEAFAVSFVTSQTAAVLDYDLYIAAYNAGFDFPDLDGRLFSVPDIVTAPSGTADFSGLYAGHIVRLLPRTDPYTAIASVVRGDVALTVNFADRLSDSTLSGSITDRGLFLPGDINLLSTADGAEDLTFTNVSIGDDGVFIGGFEGGEQVRLLSDEEDPTPTRSAYSITDTSIAGQIGGADGDTVVGVLRATHLSEIISAPADYNAKDYELYETGAFLATAD